MEEYEKALRMSGATVHVFRQFGSYEGEWWARVTYENRTGWINGYYGSCSGCDAFEAEFGYSSHECGDERYYNPFYSGDGFQEGCPTCQELKERYVKFGAEYLEQILTQEEAEARASKYMSWDLDAVEMLKFIQNNSVEKGGG